MSGHELDKIAVENFVEYLRIPSVQPNVNYGEFTKYVIDKCVEFLEKYGKDAGFDIEVIEVKTGKPVVILTLIGKQPELPSVLLNSHMDVVPVFEEMWTHPPFAAEKDSKGNIFARGSQDMKCVGIQYVEAVRRLKKDGVMLKRTLHATFVPDEEIGGNDGMKLFVSHPKFKAMNVGFALDEGVASPGPEFFVYYAERTIWQLNVICEGTTGHGSVMHDDTPGEKIRYVVDKFMDFREHEKRRLTLNPSLGVGDVTSVNLTMLSGGLLVNVVPSQLKVSFDVRIAVDVNGAEFEDMIRSWCLEAGTGVRIQSTQKDEQGGVTTLDDHNQWWLSFKSACDSLGLKLKTGVFPGGTDSRYLRSLGIPAIGFSPMNNTPILLHAHDEFLNEKVFLDGINIYCSILKAVASV